MPPNAETGSHSCAATYALVMSSAMATPQGFGVLDDHRGGTIAQLMDEPPRGLGVEEVEVRELLAAVLHGVVPPAPRPSEAVARSGLVRVLAVAQLLHAVEGERERARQHFAIRVVAIGEPRRDRRVVRGRVGERLAGERPACRERDHTLATQLVEHGVVVGGIDDHRDVRVVLRRSAHHRRATDVDRLDVGSFEERIQVRDDQPDGRDVVALEVGHVVGVVEVGEQPAVDVRMQRDDAVPEHLWHAGDIRDLGDGQARLAQRPSGVAARHELPTELVEAAPRSTMPVLS